MGRIQKSYGIMYISIVDFAYRMVASIRAQYLNGVS